MLCLQARSDWFVYVVLSALPWVGQELHQKKEKDLDNLLSQIGVYVQSVQQCCMSSVTVSNFSGQFPPSVQPHNLVTGFHLPRQQWSLLNHFHTEQGHYGACRRKWRFTDTDLCPCGETQTMPHIVESCPLTKLNGGLSRLHTADEDAVS